nr:hypothetical protein [uncultured Criibacterium sp.]
MISKNVKLIIKNTSKEKEPITSLLSLFWMIGIFITSINMPVTRGFLSMPLYYAISYGLIVYNLNAKNISLHLSRGATRNEINQANTLMTAIFLLAEILYILLSLSIGYKLFPDKDTIKGFFSLASNLFFTNALVLFLYTLFLLIVKKVNKSRNLQMKDFSNKFAVFTIFIVYISYFIFVSFIDDNTKVAIISSHVLNPNGFTTIVNFILTLGMIFFNHKVNSCIIKDTDFC